MEDNQLTIFQDTTATKKIFSLTKRIRAASGGTSASKTISILFWIIDYCQFFSNQVCTVVAESVPHLSLGAARDFQAIMKAHGYWDDNRWNETKHVYLFPNGSFVEFISFDKFGKAHGPRRNVLFINEANNIPYNIADQLMSRTNKIIWLDWNPTNEFWFYTEMLPFRDDIDFLGDGYLGPLTYLDNEALDDTIKKEIESHKHNKEWWKVYGEGKLGVITARIYRDWQILDEIDHHARLERRGLDFGYANDPASIIDIYYFNGGYILDENLYGTKFLNKTLADKILDSPNPNTMVCADSAEPKSIDEMKGYGVNIIGSEKGKDSVENGINLIQGQKISVTRRSVNILREYRNYLWKTDKNGEIIKVPEHKYSHAMDGIRYGMVSLLGKQTVISNEASPIAEPYYPGLGI